MLEKLRIFNLFLNLQNGASCKGLYSNPFFISSACIPILCLRTLVSQIGPLVPVQLENGVKKTAVTPPLTSSPHVGCLRVGRAPVDTGEYAVRPRPLRLCLHVSLRPLGSGQPVGYLSFSLRRSAPRHRQPQPSLCLSRGPDHRKPGTKLPRKKRKPFYFTFFSSQKEREIIFQGRPRRNRPLHRQRAGDSVEPLSPRRRGRREEEEQQQKKKDKVGSGSL